MDLPNHEIKGYLLMSCSDNYLTSEVIAGFAKNAVFQEKTPGVGWSDLKERDKLLTELKESFSLKKIKPLLKELIKENRLEKDTQQVRKGKRTINQTVYCLP